MSVGRRIGMSQSWWSEPHKKQCRILQALERRDRANFGYIKMLSSLVVQHWGCGIRLLHVKRVTFSL